MISEGVGLANMLLGVFDSMSNSPPPGSLACWTSLDKSILGVVWIKRWIVVC